MLFEQYQYNNNNVNNIIDTNHKLQDAKSFIMLHVKT